VVLTEVVVHYCPGEHAPQAHGRDQGVHLGNRAERGVEPGGRGKRRGSCEKLGQDHLGYRLVMTVVSPVLGFNSSRAGDAVIQTALELAVVSVVSRHGGAGRGKSGRRLEGREL